MVIKLQGTNSAAAPGLTNDGADGVVVGTDSVSISTGGTTRTTVNSSGHLLPGAADTYDLGANTTPWRNIWMQNDLYIEDDGMAVFGTGEDLKIYHQSGISYIADNGPVIVRGDGLQLQRPNGNMYVKCIAGGTVELYHDAALRFYTEANGNCARKDVNSANKFILRNLDATSGSSNQVNVIEFNFNRTGGGMDSSGARVLAGKEQEWVGGASNQDGFLAFWTMLNESVGEKFRIASNGDLTATDTSISSNSDSRLKTNIANYNYDLAKFKQLQPKTFDWKNPAMHGGKSGVRGFVAQDIEAVDPYWVSSEKVVPTYDEGDNEVANPDLSLLDADGIAKTSKLGQKDAMYISIINQLITKIETLETKVAALEAHTHE